MSSYKCDNPPCIHVVVDYSKKIYAVFVEDAEGDLLWIRASEVLQAAEKVAEYMGSGFREAAGEEVDDLAYSRLEALPLE